MFHRRLYDNYIISFFNNANGYCVVTVRCNKTNELLFHTQVRGYTYLDSKLIKYDY